MSYFDSMDNAETDTMTNKILPKITMSPKRAKSAFSCASLSQLQFRLDSAEEV